MNNIDDNWWAMNKPQPGIHHDKFFKLYTQGYILHEWLNRLKMF